MERHREGKKKKKKKKSKSAGSKTMISWYFKITQSVSVAESAVV